MIGEEATWSKTSVVRGHHLYMTVWTLYIGQSLQLCCEDDNEHNDHAVYVSKANGTVVWRALRELSHTFWYFLRCRGQIECKITGRRNRGNSSHG